MIAAELGKLASSYFKNFYELKGGSFMLTFSKEGKETAVYVNLAKTINETEFKEKAGAPSEFALAVRKKLEKSRVEGVKQHGNDRVLEIDFSGKEPRRMIIEMFDRGNLILVGKEGFVELAYKSRNFKERSVRKGAIYSFPPQGGRPVSYEEAEVSGGPEPRLYERDGEYLDFSIFPVAEYEQDAGVKAQKFPTLGRLLDSLYLKGRATEVDAEKIKEAEELGKSIEKLRKQIGELRASSEECRKIANRIFERMGDINSLLQHVNRNKIRDVEGTRGFNINVKGVDPKKRTITVELD